MPAEIAKVNEMTKQGMIEAVYTADDFSAVWIVWRVDSDSALDRGQNVLPLHPYMNSEILVMLAEEV